MSSIWHTLCRLYDPSRALGIPDLERLVGLEKSGLEYAANISEQNMPQCCSGNSHFKESKARPH